MLELLKVIWTFKNPTNWLLLDPYNKVWDDFVIENLGTIKRVSPHTINVGGVEVWACNYPYGFGDPYKPPLAVRPSRVTIYKMHKILVEEDIKNSNNLDARVSKMVESNSKKKLHLL